MRIKHTFLAVTVFALVWTGYLFAFSTGPDPGVNGISGSAASQTCAMSGCHTGNNLNAAGGSVSLGGLPATWTPGQSYPLTVTIQRTGARLFGFQLSAVVDSTNQQAGTLTPGNGRVRIICGPATPSIATQSCTSPGAVQYAEHNNAAIVTSTYLVTWTAPANASVGKVRFNVAGNAANGDGTSLGDFIYLQVSRVDPEAAPPPPPPPPDLTTKAFTMVDRGGVSLITDGGANLSVGYSRIQPDAGKTTPAGVAIFGLRQNGVVVTEAGVPASPRLSSARIYAEVTNVVNTGVAVANPNDQTANVNFHFTDAAGADFGAGVLTLGPNEQTAKFLNEAPFNVLAGRTSFQGTVSFSSNVEVSITALRGLFNERTPSEFLITTLPVTNLAVAAGSSPVVLPHFAEGGGWTTQAVLVNPTDSTVTGTIQFVSQGSATVAAAPITVTANGALAASFNYSIPRRSSFKLVTAGTPPATLAGSIRVTPVTGASPSALVIFSFKSGGITVSEAGAPGIQGSAFRMYTEVTATGGIGAVQTGFAIANLSNAAATVALELTALDGSSTGLTGSVTIPANGQTAGFVHEAFPGLPLPFKGILRISGGGASGLSVVGLRGRYNERENFLITTTPPTDESAAASTAELLFPHLVNGGGYTTQFILFSGVAGQASSGNLKFFKQDGTPLDLNVN